MNNFYDQELSVEEVNQVAGGVPIPLIVAGGIFIAGMVVSGYNAYIGDVEKSREKSAATRKHP